MLVYRIGKTKFANDLTGEGARLFGGRWNQKGTACIYTAESRALAVLEYTVNVNIDDIPRALSITTFEITDSLILQLKEEDLPGNWKQIPSPSSTKDFGTNYLTKKDIAIIKIPSSIIPEENNYLVNPLFTKDNHMRIVEIKDFSYDVRIKLN